jgi:hypothetical protein
MEVLPRTTELVAFIKVLLYAAKLLGFKNVLPCTTKLLAFVQVLPCKAKLFAFKKVVTWLLPDNLQVSCVSLGLLLRKQAPDEVLLGRGWGGHVQQAGQKVLRRSRRHQFGQKIDRVGEVGLLLRQGFVPALQPVIHQIVEVVSPRHPGQAPIRPWFLYMYMTSGQYH